MLAKKTSKNQITLPKTIANHYPDIEYFDIQEDEGRIILVPLKPSRANEVRRKLEELGITETDVQEAIDWARKA